MRTPFLITASAMLLSLAPSFAETIFGTVVKVQGNSPTIAVGGLAKALVRGAQVGPGGVISAGPTGSLVLRLTPCTALEMGEDAVISLDDLQLTRISGGVTVRQGEFTLSKGQGKFIVESMETRVNVPGGVITATQAGVFSVVANDQGDVSVTVMSGKISLTNAAGETVDLKANSHVNLAPSVSGLAAQSADDIPVAQDQLNQLQQTIENAATLGLVCEDTLTRLSAEFFTVAGITPSVPQPRSPDVPGRVPPRPPVSPER